MNQISSKISVCCRSSSLLRKPPFTRYSPSSRLPSSSSSNLIKVSISKLHNHNLNYPSPLSQIPGNRYFRNFTGEAASECDFRDEDYLKTEIRKVQSEEWYARRSIEGDNVAPLEALHDLVDKFNALMENLGLATLETNGKKPADYDDYPHHLQRFRKEIQDLVESVEMTVAYGEFVAAGGDRRWHHFMENYECMLKYPEILASLRQIDIRSRLMRKLIGCPFLPQIPGNHSYSEGAAGCNFSDDDYLKNEIWEVQDEQMRAQGDVEIGDIPPLDAIKVLADKFNAFMGKLGLKTLNDDENGRDCPQHLQKYREKIHDLEYLVDMTIAFGEYVAAGGDGSWHPFMGNYRCMIKYDEILASLRQMKIRSKLMRRLIKEKSDSQSTVA